MWETLAANSGIKIGGVIAGSVGSGILGGLGLAEVVGVLGVVVGVGWLAQ